MEMAKEMALGTTILEPSNWVCVMQHGMVNTLISACGTTYSLVESWSTCNPQERPRIDYINRIDSIGGGRYLSFHSMCT